MTEVRQSIFDRLNEERINVHLLQRANEEMHPDDAVLALVIDYYFDTLLPEFRTENRFDECDLANRDKTSALMALAILTYRPFRSLSGQANLEETARANEILAMRYAFVMLKIDDGSPADIPKFVTDLLLLNLWELGDLQRRRIRVDDAVTSNDPIMDWVIQAMQMLGLYYGTLDLTEGLPPDADDCGNAAH